MKTEVLQVPKDSQFSNSDVLKGLGMSVKRSSASTPKSRRRITREFKEERSDASGRTVISAELWPVWLA